MLFFFLETNQYTTMKDVWFFCSPSFSYSTTPTPTAIQRKNTQSRRQYTYDFYGQIDGDMCMIESSAVK